MEKKRAKKEIAVADKDGACVNPGGQPFTPLYMLGPDRTGEPKGAIVHELDRLRMVIGAPKQAQLITKAQ